MTREKIEMIKANLRREIEEIKSGAIQYREPTRRARSFISPPYSETTKARVLNIWKNTSKSLAEIGGEVGLTKSQIVGIIYRAKKEKERQGETVSST